MSRPLLGARYADKDLIEFWKFWTSKSLRGTVMRLLNVWNNLDSYHIGTNCGPAIALILWNISANALECFVLKSCASETGMMIILYRRPANKLFLIEFSMVSKRSRLALTSSRDGSSGNAVIPDLIDRIDMIIRKHQICGKQSVVGRISQRKSVNIHRLDIHNSQKR